MSLKSFIQEKIKEVLNISEYLDNSIEKQKSIMHTNKCPACKEPVKDKFKFCKCGYVSDKEKNKKIFLIVSFTWLLIFAVCFVIYNSFYPIGTMINNNMNLQSSLPSISSVDVRILTKLKDTKYYNYIHEIYIYPKEDNRLGIMIKPIYWNTITDREKDDLLSIINKEWKKIYSEVNPDSDLQPEANFANL